MTAPDDHLLNSRQLESLRKALHQGAEEATSALSKWLGKHTMISVDAVRQLPLHDATTVLGEGDEPIGFCSTEMTGRLTGELILAFDDISGLTLADLLLDQPRGTAKEWNEMETSAALETTNILCCAYLNSLTRILPPADHGPSELVPAPPRLRHDFAESLIQFALMGQVEATDQVLLAQTQFRIDGAAVNWTLLFVPDAESMISLGELLE